MQTGKPGRPTKRVKRIAADKGYDSQVLRESLRRKGIQAQIAQRRNAKVKSGRPVEKSAPRLQVERTFAWLQRKFRRLTIQWERFAHCFDAFLSLAITFMWIQRLVG